MSKGSDQEVLRPVGGLGTVHRAIEVRDCMLGARPALSGEAAGSLTVLCQELLTLALRPFRDTAALAETAIRQFGVRSRVAALLA